MTHFYSTFRTWNKYQKSKASMYKQIDWSYSIKPQNLLSKEYIPNKNIF